MDFMDVLYGRRAIREYSPEPVSRGVLAELIAAATSAPSAMNHQPWAFVVIDGKERLERLGREAKNHLLDTLPPDSPMAAYRERLEADDFHLFHNAPALVVICATEDESQAREDCCLAAENLMLTAFAKGLGTCWIGFARPWFNLPHAKAELGFPDTFYPVAPIVIGHPSVIPSPTPRAAPMIVVCD